jgi:Ca2+/Na+ antiporter
MRFFCTNRSAAAAAAAAAAVAAPAQASLRQRTHPRPARFAAVFGAMAVSVTLYHAATQPWAAVDSPASVARRRLAATCEAARSVKLDGQEQRLHTSYPGPFGPETGGAYYESLPEASDYGTADVNYKCAVQETGELFDYLATAESCSAASAVLGVSNIKGSNKKKCEDEGGTYTPHTIDVSSDAQKETVKAQIETFLTEKEFCIANEAAGKAACEPVGGLTKTQCEANSACKWANSNEFVNDWKVAICHLLVATGRDAKDETGEISAALVAEMAEWSTHDDKANAATGELDASDFNKMMSKPIFNWGLFLWYVFATFYLFCGIAIVCDDFFTASLESLSIKFELSEDVAGATFMAAGSSAPELFTSLSSVIIIDECANRSSVGVGTIVGSAIFNILVIIGATCMLAGQALQLGWKPMIRDTCWYALSIALLIIFVLPEDVQTLKELVGDDPSCGDPLEGKEKCKFLTDNQYIEFDSTGDGKPDTVSSTGVVTWWEGLIMWLAYLGYIVFMHFNEAILGETADKVTDEEPEDRVRRKSVAGDDEGEGDKKDPEAGNTTTDAEEKKGGEDDDEDDPVDCIGVPIPDALGDKVFTYFSYPWYVFFMITIPDCESEKWKNWYWVSFINSIVWIGVICYGMVEFAILIGQMCDISSTVMGLTVLSAGTSVPDAISSIVVAQRGLGDMAISNALGSNVFDILLGLGFPYFLSALKEGKPVTMCVDDVSVYLVCLVIVLIIVVGTFSAFKFVLRPVMGVILIVTYVLFFLMAVFRDQGVIDLGLACDAGH